MLLLKDSSITMIYIAELKQWCPLMSEAERDYLSLNRPFYYFLFFPYWKNLWQMPLSWHRWARSSLWVPWMGWWGAMFSLEHPQEQRWEKHPHHPNSHPPTLSQQCHHSWVKTASFYLRLSDGSAWDSDFIYSQIMRCRSSCPISPYF